MSILGGEIRENSLGWFWTQGRGGIVNVSAEAGDGAARQENRWKPKRRRADVDEDMQLAGVKEEDAEQREKPKGKIQKKN